MNKADYELQRDCIYRELLKNLTRISMHPMVQSQMGLRDSCVAIAKNARTLNQLMDEVFK
jgi:hypothetical protein